jgi:hypothetical protein
MYWWYCAYHAIKDSDQLIEPVSLHYKNRPWILIRYYSETFWISCLGEESFPPEKIKPRPSLYSFYWQFLVSFTHRPPYPQGKRTRYPLDRRLSGPQFRSGLCGHEKKVYWESNPGLHLVTCRYTDWKIPAWNNNSNNNSRQIKETLYETDSRRE